MSASFNESQKLDYLWKKIGYGVAKTSIPPPGSGSKEAFNESIASPLLYRGDLVWKDSGSIPSNPPTSTSSIVQVYKDGGGGGYSATVQCTEDLTAPDNQTWKTNLANWIPTQFGDNYLVLVYVDTTGSTTPQTTGTRLFQAGSGSDDTWFFDYQAGILNFNGAAIPSVITGGVTGKSVFIVGYRYVGTFGVGGDTGNITFSNTTITTALANANITITPTGTGVVIIDTTTGLVVPVGNTVQRPSVPSSGTVRLNNSTGLIEFYNGVGWVSLSSSGGVTISNQTINPNGTDASYTLDQTATAASMMVTTNGVAQTPDIDYTASGTTITFTTTPIPTDIIQIRFLAGISSTDFITNSSGNAVIKADSTGNVILTAPVGKAVTSNVDILTTGAVSATGNVTGNYILGNAAYLTGLPASYGNSNVAAYLPTYSGNISSGNANIVGGTLAFANASIVQTNPLDLAITGAYQISIKPASGSYQWTFGNDGALTGPTGVGVTGYLSAIGNVTGGNILFGSGIVSGTGNVNGNVVTATTLNATTVSASGNVTGGNLSVGTGAVSIGSIVNNNANGVGNIGSSSKYFNTVFATATTALYADLAEKFTSDSDYPPGTVVVFGGNKQVTVATTYADPHAAGIVSTDPAYLMNAGLTETAVSLALAGQVPCFVMGPVHKGDLLTTSDTEGYACKLDPKDWQPGVAIGKALENCSTGPHKINVLAINS